MPKATVREGSDLYPLPEQTVFDAQLLSCTQETVTFTYRNGPNAGQPGSFDKWEWTFVITTPGEYNNIEIKGSTEPKITDANENDGFLALARVYVEALLGRPIQLGEEIDTDDLLGLPCKLTARHEEPRPRKKGDGYWYNVAVDEVYPAGGAPAAAGVAPAADPWAAPAVDEPPF